MPACTFFGHRDCPDNIRQKLKEKISGLIELGIDNFYVGDKGNFDTMVCSILKELSRCYEIRYTVVLSSLPQRRMDADEDGYLHTLFPDSIEKVPPRFRISWRNRWMLHRSDYVITYVKYTWGGAAQFAELAKKQKKTVINLTE